MSQKPELKSSPLGSNPAPAPGPTPISAPLAPPNPLREHDLHPQRIPHWLERGELFLRVMLRMYIGLAVCYAPWSHMFWDQNPLFARFPTLAIFASNGAVRGLVSGLGLLNLWIAFSDVLRRRNG
jgi:hypothetical protein